MKLYREVKVSERLPEKQGPYFVMISEHSKTTLEASQIFGQHDIYYWQDNDKDEKEFWVNTFESWLEPIEIREEDIRHWIIYTHEYHGTPVYSKVVFDLAATILSKLKPE
jgi:hypothetical protein